MDLSPSPAAPLTPQHLRELAEAELRAKKIKRAVKVAAFDGWTLGFLAATTFMCGIFSLVAALLLGAGMGVVTFIELRGANRLRRLDPTAPRMLGFNQIGLGCLLIAYAIWQLILTVKAPNTSMGYTLGDPAMDNLLGSMEDLSRTIELAVYFGLIAFAIVCQGSTAWYYFSRTKHIRDYVQMTPAWVLDLQRSGIRLP